MRRGVLSQAELEDAVEALVVAGGRLGTNLLDLGYLGVEELDRYLAEHLGAPLPPEAWLLRPEPEALAAVPKALARRHGVLPLAIEKGTLHLAVPDPRDVAVLDEIAFAAGLRVQAYVLSEAHLAVLRERHLRLPRGQRFVDALEHPARRRRPQPATSDAVRWSPRPEDEAACEQREVLGIHPLTPEEELMDLGTFSHLHSSWQEGEADAAPAAGDAEPEADEVWLTEPGPEPGPLTPGEVARLERELAEAGDRDTVGDCALRIARTYAETAALFVVQRDALRGWRALGDGIGNRIAGILLPLEASCFLTRAAAGTEAFRGAPPRDGIDAHIFRALARGDAREAAILPVAINDRVVNLLYVDNGAEPLAESSLAALGAVCDAMARTYQQLILARRSRYC